MANFKFYLHTAFLCRKGGKFQGLILPENFDMSYSILCNSRMFQIQNACRMFQNVPEFMQINITEWSRMHAEYYRIFQDACRMFQNIPECSRILKNACRLFQNVLECLRIHAECSRMFQNALEYMQKVTAASRSMSLHAHNLLKNHRRYGHFSGGV